jgi:hypothetical protein
MYALCLFLLLLPMAQQQRSHDPLAKKHNTQKPNTESQNKQPSSGDNGITGNYQIHEPQKKTQEEQDTDAFDRGFQRVYWGATILGVMVSLGLFCALIHQNKLTRKAAKASQQSADALIRIEMAWLYFWYEKFIHSNYQDITTGVHEAGHHLNWQCENSGKTPAFIIATWHRLIEIKSLGDLPPQPNYSMRKEVPYAGDPLRTGDKTYWFTAHLESTEADSTYDAVDKRHRSRESFIYGYGFVRYRDVFGRVHRAKFGIVYESQPELNFDMDHWRVAGPATYNGYEENIGQ